MKAKLILLAGLFYGLVASAQTNTIIFAQLLSPTNSVLMTNAEFRCFSGNHIIFKNDSGYQVFRAPDLSTNVLVALHISAAKLDSQQQAMTLANQRYKEQVAAAAAEQERQKQLAIQQKITDREKRIAKIKAYQADHPTYNPGPYVTDRNSIGLGP